jgi:hypothetical protein
VSLTDPPRELVTILDRTAFRYGHQGSTKRLSQIATAWGQLGSGVTLIRSDLKFASSDGALARAAFPGEVVDVPPSAPLQFLHSSKTLRPLATQLKQYFNLPQYHWSPTLLDRELRTRIASTPGLIWAVCKGSIENMKFGASLARETRRPWVVSLHDPPTGLLRDGEVQEPILANVAPLFDSCAHICTTSATLRDVLIERLRIAPDHITNIPLREEPRPAIAARYVPDPLAMARDGSTFVIVHAGQLHGDASPGLRSLRPLLEAIRLIRISRREPDISIVSMGMGAGHAEAVRYAGALGLDGTFMALGSQERSTVDMLESTADAVIIVQGEAQRHQLPSKVFDLLALDRPILALVPEGSEVERILTSSGRALVAPPTDVAAIARHVTTMISGGFSPSAPTADHGRLMDGYRLESLPGQLLDVMARVNAQVA